MMKLNIIYCADYIGFKSAPFNQNYNETWLIIKLDSEFDVRIYIQFVCEFGWEVFLRTYFWWWIMWVVSKIISKNETIQIFLYT